MPVDHTDLKQTWREMEAVHMEELARATGVSNLQPKHLGVILDGAKAILSVNQVRPFVTHIYDVRLIDSP